MQVKTQRGFTLVELMVTVAIVAILATVAIPRYSQYVQRADRSDAIAPMQSILNAQERFFLNNRQYTVNLADLGIALNADNEYVVDNYLITARNCRDGNNAAIGLNMCVEIFANSTGSQADDGDLVMNTMGRSGRIDTGGTEHDL